MDFTGRIINANEDLLTLNGELQSNLSAHYSGHGGIGKFNMLHMAVVQRIFFAGDSEEEKYEAHRHQHDRSFIGSFHDI